MRKIKFFLLIFLGCSEIINLKKEGSQSVTNPPGGVFLSQYNTMQLLGDFNGWSIGDLEGTRMDLVDDWLWVKVIYFSSPRTIMFKFVPNQNWDLAYGTPNDDQGRLEGYALPGQGGLGNHIDAYIPQRGFWQFIFNENTGYYTIRRTETPGGVIHGRVRFTDDSIPPFPRAYVILYSENTGLPSYQTTSDTLTGDFLFTSVEEGRYFLVGSAENYLPDTIFGLSSSNDTIRNLLLILERIYPPQDTLALPDPPFFTPNVDGYLNEWTAPQVDDTIGDSPWGPDGDIGDLYVSKDSLNLYIGLDYSLGLNQNALIIYIRAFTPDTLDNGDTSMLVLDFYPRNFHFNPQNAPEFVIARWGHGVPFAMRKILRGGQTQEITNWQVADIPLGGRRRSCEIRIPLRTLYGYEDGFVPPYAKIRLVAVVAGGDNYGGPETVPHNPIPQESGPILLTNLFELILDHDGN